MKKDFIKMIILFSGIFFIYSCGDSNGSQSDLIITKNNNGQTVGVNFDKKIIIELDSNPSTGYRWKHANSDGSLFYQEGESTFIENPDCSSLVGCGGVERLTFRATERGSSVISLVYQRSFEDEPIHRFSINVNVH